MKVFSAIHAIREYLSKERTAWKSIGFVPTMGALHEGHLSLIRRSTGENDLTVCSVFVNPIQFNNKHDLATYPRTLDTDLKILEKSGCDVVFAPKDEEMYPNGETGGNDIDFGYLDKILEGKFRPGHFRGVAIVVKKFFEIIEPGKAYFGKKDYQQFLVISEMVKKCNLPVEIIPCMIIREPDGLAMSSRNMRLTIGERIIAPLIYETLSGVKEKAGTLPVKKVKEWAIKKISKNPAFIVEYIEIADKNTLSPLQNWKTKEKAIVLAAVKLNDIRLIDNIEFFI
jgi:pantoate--beta-alanine ligase